MGRSRPAAGGARGGPRRGRFRGFRGWSGRARADGIGGYCPPPMANAPPPLKLSVVIPCLNAAATIGVQLEALARQSWEGEGGGIGADNGSPDDPGESGES